MGGIAALIVLIILSFVVFIVWARSTAGQKTLRANLGEPTHSFRKRQRLARRHAAVTGKSHKPGRAKSPASRR